MEIIESIYKALIEPFVEGFFRGHPVLGGLSGAAIVLTIFYGWWKRNRRELIKLSLRIHYTYYTRERGHFESVTKIKVLKKELREYKTGLGATRELTSPITTRDPKWRVDTNPTPTGDRRHFTVFISPPLQRGEHSIPLEADFKDPNVANPKIEYQLPIPIKELVIVVQLNPNEKIKAAWGSVIKPGQTICVREDLLWVWRNNVFVAVFRNTKPGLSYEVTWDYDEPADTNPIKN